MLQVPRQDLNERGCLQKDWNSDRITKLSNPENHTTKVLGNKTLRRSFGSY